MSSTAIAAGPPAAPAGFRVETSDAQVAAFQAQGFLAVERLTIDEEVAWLPGEPRAAPERDARLP